MSRSRPCSSRQGMVCQPYRSAAWRAARRQAASYAPSVSWMSPLVWVAASRWRSMVMAWSVGMSR